jgi:uncharacterized membrane protein
MGLTYQLLFWVHMVALALGGVGSLGIPFVGMQLRTATAETRPVLFRLVRNLSTAGRVAFGLLIITGPLLFWLGWSGTAPQMWAFTVKMVLVVVLLVIIIAAGINGKRAENGDAAAGARAPILGIASAITFILIILAAALAFK